jgi:membrane-bound metal-dependent hydrolase YbcI (DUF457 family)
MTAAHFAAALAIKARVPRAPTAALIVGAFLPDFLGIGLAAAGVELTAKEVFFDDWSHSLAMVLVWAAIYALAFWRRGRGIALAMGLAVLTHFLLDMPIHPKDLALYPHSTIHLGWGLWSIGRSSYWYVQLAVTVVLLAAYAIGARGSRLPARSIGASCALVLGWHLVQMPPS